MLRRTLRARAHRIANAALERTWARLRVTGAIAPGTAAAERFGSFGQGSVIAFPTTALYGESAVHVGAGTMVGPWCTLAAGYSPDQQHLPERTLVLGDRCVIGTRSMIVAHESIEIGDDVWFGPAVYVTDANHGYQDPDTPIGRQLGAHDPVRIGDGSWIGYGAVVLPGATIGRNVVVAAGSVVRGHLPDHAVCGGVPARVIRRYVPGIGWERAEDGADVRPPTPTVDPAELAAALARLEAIGAHTDDQLAAARADGLLDESPRPEGRHG